MKKSVGYFVIIALLMLYVSGVKSQNCSVSITAPKNGTNVSGNGLISGHVDLPADGHLWLLSHKVGFNGWWPQGNGEAQIIGNTWDVLVYFGVENDFGQFEVIALVVDNQTHRNLEDWVRTAKEKDYPPIPLPTSVDGCTFARVRVEKTSN